jgi:hypothetical protein
MPATVGASEARPPGHEHEPEETEGGLARSGLAFLRRFKKDD